MVQRQMLSLLAQEMGSSAILALNAQVKALQAKGKKITNFTIGDFNSTEFRIPEELRKAIENEYDRGNTNYSPPMGETPLREAVSAMYKRELKLDYSTDEVVIGSGGRSIIYGTFATVVDAGDKVFFGVPCWNYHYYCKLIGAIPQTVITEERYNFFPRESDLEKVIGDVALVVLNSPNNPAGTLIDRLYLRRMCEIILKENESRKKRTEKPCYLLYDQIYWRLRFEGDHHHPVTLFPEMKEYTIYADGVSKNFAGTGVRVGWGLGPANVIERIGAMGAFTGSFAPKPEQLATAQYLAMEQAQQIYLSTLTDAIYSRLTRLMEALFQMRDRQALPVSFIKPQGGMYLAVLFDIIGYHTPDGKKLHNVEDITNYLIQNGIACVPFELLDATGSGPWYRISVTGILDEELKVAIEQIRTTLSLLQPI